MEVVKVPSKASTAGANKDNDAIIAHKTNLILQSLNLGGDSDFEKTIKAAIMKDALSTSQHSRNPARNLSGGSQHGRTPLSPRELSTSQHSRSSQAGLKRSRSTDALRRR